MLRTCLGTVLLVLWAVSGLEADEIKGKLKKVDAGKGIVIVTVGNKDQQFVVGPDAKVVTNKGDAIKEGLKAKGLGAGAQVTITTASKDGQEVVTELKLVSAAPANVFLTAEDAGPDFVIQGEYEGELSGKAKLGAQVFAEGNGKFMVVFLPGGLPGAGWDAKTRIKSAAVSEGGKTTVNGGGFSGEIADGKLTGKSSDGAFTLQKVIRQSPTLGAKPPAGAIVLFDGTSVDEWKGGKLVEGNLLSMGTSTVKTFAGPFKLHLEFRTPFQPTARGQGRGNSGVYVLGTEVQVLDSFALEGKNNECGGIYGKKAPDVNMCFPPLSWQTYDMELRDGAMTVYHNGVKIHDAVPWNKGPGGINLQNHGNPVYYRNIWLLPLDK
jgi:hypothetical protein